MQINHNIRAMVTQHALYSNNSQMSKSLEKLSTGLKINRAQDDAAGLAMSEQMRTQIRGLGKAKQNSQDSIAALQIAEGGLQEITNLMQRQRELAVQSANDTLTSTERKYLNDEFQELTKEIARIGKTTDYNGKNMLNWDEDPNKSFGAMGGADQIKAAVEKERDDLDIIKNKLSNANAQDDVNTYKDAIDTYLTAIDNAATTFKGGGSKADYDTAVAAAKAQLDTDYTTLASAIDNATGNWTGDADKRLGDELKARITAFTQPNQAIDSLTDVYSKVAISDGNTAASYTLHIGANYSFGIGGKWGNEMTVTYISMNPAALGLTTKHIKTQNGATEAIDQLDKVIKSVSGVRAKIGTFINRLEYTINNIANLEFNTQDAESRIRDTDFGKETTNFTRNQIMVQSSTSMLAQANSLPQAVLGLLG
jgi:flagellin